MQLRLIWEYEKRVRQTKVILSHILARAHVLGEEKSKEEQRRG